MKIENDVLAVLSRCTLTGTSLVLPSQLDRKMYERTNKVIEAAGGKWDRKAKAHLFASDADTRVDQIILTGEVEVPKDEFNYFPTPLAVVDRLMELAEIKPGMRVLEPSAGRGAIALACADQGATVDCVELMDANYQELRKINNGLWLGGELTHGDFLACPPVAIYDRIVMNPPFMKQSDIRHVMHALKFLKADGLLVSVMGSSVTFRDNTLTQLFRDTVRNHGGDIEALPEGSFKQSGTMVNTVIVTIPGVLA